MSHMRGELLAKLKKLVLDILDVSSARCQFPMVVEFVLAASRRLCRASREPRDAWGLQRVFVGASHVEAAVALP